MTTHSIPYGRQNIQEDDIKAIVQVLSADFLTQGPKVSEFEDKFAKYVDSKYAVAVNNATSGLHLSVLALNLKENERVITTPITFAASANCVKYVKGEVWFADIDPDTYLLNIEKVKELIDSKPSGFFSGLIVVDFAGNAVNIEEFRVLANEHDLWIIEDACHAPGGGFTDSKGNLSRCGSGDYADLAVFSFHPVKHIACGEGGMVTTNSKELYDKLIRLRSHGITKDYLKEEEDHGGWFYEMRELGHNYRLTDIQSALGISQLAKNNKGVLERNRIAKKYQEAFGDRIKFQLNKEGVENAYHLFVIEVDNRRSLYDVLRSKGIYAQIHYIPVHELSYYKQFDHQQQQFVHAENYYKHCISLPMYPSLTDEEINYVIKVVTDCTAEHR